MSEQHDAAQHEAAAQHDTQLSVFEGGEVPVETSETTAPAKRKARANKPAATPFKRRENISDDDRVSFTLPHAVEKMLLAERDRLDAPVDGIGRKRHQQSRDDFLERLVRIGLDVTANRPDWKDPLQP